MATLPADRTKLALAQNNQVPNMVIASAKNINSIVEAYDTIDLLNQKVDTNYGTGAIGTNQLAANSVTLNQMADNSVGTAELVAASVTLAKMAAASVGTSQLVDGSVTDAKIASGVITADKFVAGALNNDTQNGLLITALQADVVQRGTNVMSAPYNAKFDGVTDDSAAIQAAINAVYNAGGGFVILPFGTAIYTSLVMKNNVFLFSFGATLKLKANQPATDSIQFYTVSNCGILGKITFDGNRSNQINSVPGVAVKLGCTYLSFGDITVQNFSEDGFYIGGSGTPCSDIDIYSLYLNNNGRNGLSITNGKNLYFRKCIATNTTGSAPKNGVDIEPNLSTDTIDNIIFDTLIVSGNAGDGVQVLGKSFNQGQVTFKYIRANSNVQNGAHFEYCSNVKVLSGSFYSNTLAGIVLPRNVRHIQVKADIYLNGYRGVDAAMSSQSSLQSYDLNFSGSRFYNNSQNTPNSVDGARFDSDDAAILLARIYLNDIEAFDDQGSKTQRYGFSLGTNTQLVRMTGYCPVNATGAYVSSGASAYIVKNGFSGVATISTFGTIPANSCVEVTVTIAGANTGSSVRASPIAIAANVVWSAYVSTTNTIKIRVCNPTTSGIAVASTDWYIEGVQF